MKCTLVFTFTLILFAIALCQSFLNICFNVTL